MPLQRRAEQARIRPVKILGSLLILLIALHSACMAQCVGEGTHTAKETTAPPCEHHQTQSGTPNGAGSSSPSTSCSEGPALEAKISTLVKCTLTPAVVPGSLVAAVAALSDFCLVTQDSEGPPTSPISVRLSVLRI